MSTATDAGAEQGAQAEAWVRGFAAGWKDPVSAEAFIDHFTPLLDPEIRLIQPQMPDLVGLEPFRRGFVEPLFGLIPDLHGTVGGWASEGDRIWIELRLEGTLGGRPVSVETVDRVTLRDGRAIERRAYLDPLPLLAAAATRPRACPGFARFQARQALAVLRARRAR